RNGVRKACELQRQYVSFRHAEHHVSDGLRLRDTIGESRIAEANIMLERVVVRMIDTCLIIFTAVFDAQPRNPQVLNEWGEVGARAERIDGQIAVGSGEPCIPARLPGGALVIASDQHPGPRTGRRADTCLGVPYRS